MNVYELDKIKKVCEAVDIEDFVLKQTSTGIGRILTMTYETTIQEYDARVSIEISGIESW
jgi:hypothetical protein